MKPDCSSILLAERIACRSLKFWVTFALNVGQVMLEAALAATVHVGGHALAALAAGLRLRVVLLSLSLKLLCLRRGSVVFILKAVPMR